MDHRKSVALAVRCVPLFTPKRDSGFEVTLASSSANRKKDRHAVLRNSQLLGLARHAPHLWRTPPRCSVIPRNGNCDKKLCRSRKKRERTCKVSCHEVNRRNTKNVHEPVEKTQSPWTQVAGIPGHKSRTVVECSRTGRASWHRDSRSRTGPKGVGATKNLDLLVSPLGHPWFQTSPGNHPSGPEQLLESPENVHRTRSVCESLSVAPRQPN